ncbi:DUF7322 domain-containing protein [Natranaeroarchaeum sulfidigenes]|uniref:Putative membrane protein n=1 Tax=Natranaeroarchaeum sulfidigenes TaxID=2784880 RepID=A0A897MS03_9EURY|nr:hypothetical protein [Natranaeroarchaeum sulfidigenes]QSG03222.1 putative membrane protein [Natranaeroarchaeum sulfidigenes]
MNLDDPLEIEPNDANPEDELDFDVLDAEENLTPEIPDGSNAPSEIKKAFWSVFLLVKIGITSGSIGALLLVLTPYRQVGAVLFVIGLFSLVHAYVKYQRAK